MKFDHAIIAVDDLDTAVEDYRSLGFTVIYGGEHTAGTTHNALICFQDGSYFELLAPTGKPPKAGVDAVDFSTLLKDGEGLVGYALYSDDLRRDTDAMRERGVNISDPKPGSRTRKDGVHLRWLTASIDGSMSPFFIQDETERSLRVPDDEVTTTHENGTLGIANVFILTDDEDKTTQRYHDLLGHDILPGRSDKVFELDESYLTILHLKAPVRPGEQLYRIVLHTSQDDHPRLPLEKTHQARIVLFPEQESGI